MEDNVYYEGGMSKNDEGKLNLVVNKNNLEMGF